MKRFALILLALAATAMLSGCWNSSGTAQPSPTASLAPTATADNPVEGALDELATDMPGSLEGGEIMPPHKPGRGVRHRPQVQRPAHMPYPAGE